MLFFMSLALESILNIFPLESFHKQRYSDILRSIKRYHWGKMS